MLKEARKPSSDPVQEKIRTDKAAFNAKVSTFINDLIHYKKLMNGWPNKFYKERSRIFEPMPGDPVTIIGSLAGDFQEIAQQSNSIISEQLEYSKNRKQKKTAPNPNQLNFGFAATQMDYNLISEGSNPLSRFLFNLKNTTLSDSPEAMIKMHRKSWMKACVKMKEDLNLLQAEIVGKSFKSIFKSSKILIKIIDNFKFIEQGFLSYKESDLYKSTKNIKSPIDETAKNTNVISPSITNPSIIDSVNLANKYIEDYSSHLKYFKHNLFFDNINQDIEKFKSSKAKIIISREIVKKYNTLIGILNKKYNTSGNSLKEIIETIPKTDEPISIEDNEINVVAQNVIKKWINKTLHQVLNDKTSSYRLDIYNNIKNIKQDLNSIMDSLEKSLDIKDLEPLITSIDSKLIIIHNLMKALELNIKGIEYSNPFLDYLNTNNKLTKDQNNHLKKMIETKNLRDLVKTYSEK